MCHPEIWEIISPETAQFLIFLFWPYQSLISIFVVTVTGILVKWEKNSNFDKSFVKICFRQELYSCPRKIVYVKGKLLNSFLCLLFMSLTFSYRTVQEFSFVTLIFFLWKEILVHDGYFPTPLVTGIATLGPEEWPIP